MKSSILSSFFFLQMVENYKIYQRTNKIKNINSNYFNKNKDEVMKLFSVVYTIMETQAVGLPISEEDLEISASLISSFSWQYCMGVSDPYVVTQIMWEAYRSGSISAESQHYVKIHNMTKNIINSLAKDKV